MIDRIMDAWISHEWFRLTSNTLTSPIIYNDDILCDIYRMKIISMIYYRAYGRIDLKMWIESQGKVYGPSEYRGRLTNWIKFSRGYSTY